jgi:cyclin-dependent kinase 7
MATATAATEGLAAYAVGEKVGRGGTADVHKAIVRATGGVVAIKKMKRCQEIVQRELYVLRHLTPHTNVVTFLETFEQKDNAYIVFEYLQMNMGVLLAALEAPLTEAQARGCLEHVLNGLVHLHSLGIIHRDIKPSNLLVALDRHLQVQRLKISDFGVAMIPDPVHPTSFLQEGTLWYQPPELFFGLRYPVNAYHVDTWALGCVFAEILTKQCLFTGDNSLAMLTAIFAVLGSPTEASWPGVTQLRCYLNYEGDGVGLEATLQAKGIPAPPSADCLSLLGALLQPDPAQRISPADALCHPFLAGPREAIFVPVTALSPLGQRNLSPRVRGPLFGDASPSSPALGRLRLSMSPASSPAGAQVVLARRLEL